MYASQMTYSWLIVSIISPLLVIFILLTSLSGLRYAVELYMTMKLPPDKLCFIYPQFSILYIALDDILPKNDIINFIRYVTVVSIYHNYNICDPI